MSARSSIVTLVAILLSIERAPAPIQEVPQPTPTPATAQPRGASAASPGSESKAHRFAGTWSGIVTFKDPFVGGGGKQQCDFTIDADETTMIIRVTKVNGGAHHTATTRVVVIGNTASAKGGFLKHMSTTMTLTGDGTTADVVLHDSIWGTSSGNVKKIK